MFGECENGKQCVDRNFRLCMDCLDYNRKLRHRDLYATVNIRRLSETHREEKQSQPYLKPEMQEIEHKKAADKTR
jgi:hypothetical protein